MAKARKPGVRILTGDKALDAKLRRLKIGGANRIARKALVKAMRLAVKSMKAQVPARYKDAKRTISWVVDKKGGAKRDEHRAKAGAGVGRGYGAESSKRQKAKAKGGSLSGVGIGGRNIHWFVLGTRYSDAILPLIVKSGFAAARASMTSAIRETVKLELAKEAAKK